VITNDKYLTVEEAAETLRVSIVTLRRWLAAGRLSAKRAGRRLLIPSADVQMLLERNTAVARGGRLVPGIPAELDENELVSFGNTLVAVLQAGGWPIELLPITCESLRPILTDPAGPGALFWRTLIRGIDAVQFAHRQAPEPPQSGPPQADK
jgi:excisionase family DNA binding protein